MEDARFDVRMRRLYVDVIIESVYDRPGDAECIVHVP